PDARWRRSPSSWPPRRRPVPPCHRRARAAEGPRTRSLRCRRGASRHRSGRRTAGIASCGLLPKLENGLADSDGNADLYRRRAVDLASVEIGAVGRTEILNQPHAVVWVDPSMMTGGVVVVEHDRRVGGPPDGNRCIAEWHRGTAERAGGDDELGWCPTLRFGWLGRPWAPTGGPGGSGAPGLGSPPWCGSPAAARPEDVRTHHRDR